MAKNEQPVRLGLIGDNIAASKAPDLHRLAGTLCGLSVTYDRLVPRDMNLDFDGVFGAARDGGYRGLNITYPYKERALSRVRIDDPRLLPIGAINTVLFGADGPVGHNTDFTGFIAAWQARFQPATPGSVCVIGTGGVGKAVCHGLLALGADEIRLFDLDAEKARSLAENLRGASDATAVTTAGSAEEAAEGATGVINCSPVGMVGYDGTPIAPQALSRAAWAFDAVYTPIRTRFLIDAEQAGVEVLSGYELFFHQGVDAFRLFCGREVDPRALRAALIDAGAGPG